MKKTIFKIFLLFIGILVFIQNVQSNSLLIGVWGPSKLENAQIVIKKDSIYYLESNSFQKYQVSIDSIFIDLGDNESYSAKYLLKGDSLIFSNSDGIFRLVSLPKGRTPVVSVFSLKPGFQYVSSRIEDFVKYATFSLSFYPNTTMIINNNYFVATVGKDFWPDTLKTVFFSENGRKWNITIKPDGRIYLKIVSGTNLNAAVRVSFDLISYSLY